MRLRELSYESSGKFKSMCALMMTDCPITDQNQGN